MESNVLTLNLQIGRKLLCKSRMESSPDGDHDISGVLMGDERYGAPLATIVLLFSAHLFAPDEHVRDQIERVIHIMDPNATVVSDKGHSTQHPLKSSEGDDIPF